MRMPLLISLVAGLLACVAAAGGSRPNILFCLSDDQSWPHSSAYGEPVIQTPVFDRIAREGALFNQAYCAAPSCTPSRSAILTGQDIWRLGEGGQLFGTLPAIHPTYTDLLIQSGYPARMIRTRDYLYIRNYEPEREPAGDFRVVTNEGSHGDIDASPTKSFLLANKDAYPRFFELAFGKRPKEELYDCREDPYQLNNLASDPARSKTLQELSERLASYLKATGDPRETSGEAPWDGYKYYGKSNWPTLPQNEPSSKD